jgi:DNA-binding transcriptional LysR family regulator
MRCSRRPSSTAAMDAVSDETGHPGSIRHVDMAVRIGVLPDSSIIATRVGSMRTVVCARAELLAGHCVPKSPEGLAGLLCVNFEFLSPASAWPFRLKSTKGTADVPIRPRLSVTTAEAAVWAAAQGVGVTRVLHYQCADAINDGSLRIILANFEVEPLPVHLLHAGRGALPSKMRVFLDFRSGRLRESLSSPDCSAFQSVWVLHSLENVRDAVKKCQDVAWLAKAPVNLSCSPRAESRSRR